jgi:AcrR family transcriptional regulator
MAGTIAVMKIADHRHRVAAERRERMRGRLLTSAMALVAQKGPAAVSIDDVISAADVSRGTFYKYFASPEVLVQELAVNIANELIRLAEPVVQRFEDPAERVSCGMRLVARLARVHPLAASFLVRLGWPDVAGSNILLEFVERDLAEGLRRGRFMPMPLPLTLNIVAGAVLGAANCMLRPGCDEDFAEQTAAAALRALGLGPEEARRISVMPLASTEIGSEGLLAQVSAAAVRASKAD